MAGCAVRAFLAVRTVLETGARLGFAVAVVAALGCDEPEDPKRVEAARLKQKAFQMLAVKDYAGAIDLLEKADVLVPHPNWQFDLAVAFAEWGGHCEQVHEAMAEFDARCKGSCSAHAVAAERFAALRKGCLPVVRIETQPPGATLRLGDEVLGKAPIEIRRELQGAALIASKAGYDDATQTVTATPGVQRTITLSLRRRHRGPPRAPKSDVVIEDIKLAGGASDAHSAALTGRHRAAVERCYGKSGLGDPVTLHLVLQPDGKTRRIAVRPDDVAARRLKACLGTKLAFPVFEGALFGSVTAVVRKR